MGDVVYSPSAELIARVLGADSSYQLLVVKDGPPWRTVPVEGGSFEAKLPADGFGRYRLQLQRGRLHLGAVEPDLSP